MKNYLLFSLFIVFCSCESSKKFSSEITPVEVGRVVKSITFSGRIRAKNSVVVRAPIHSQLVKFYQSLGSEVKRDEVLVTLTEPKNNDRLTALIEKKGQLREVLLKKSQLELKIDRNRKEVARMSRLLASGSVAKSERDRARIVYDLELKEFEIIKSREKTLKSSIAHLNADQKQASRRLKSPIRGTITELWADERKISAGMTIPKDTIIAVIEEPGEYILRSDVTEGDYIALQIGQSVDITVDHLDQSKVWRGKVKSLAPVAEKTRYGVSRFSVDVLFDSSSYPLRTGLQGKGALVLSEKMGVLRIPRSALLTIDKKHYVSIPYNNAVKRHNVEIGLIGDEYVEVTAGLTAKNVIYKSFVE